MKKAFTLIELLAVIVILAVIVLISTPIILDVVEDSRKSADRSSANLVLDAARNYYAESMLDISKQDKIKKEENLFYELEMQNKPKEGTVYINEEGKVALVLVLNKTCYVKSYNTNIEEYELDSEECDLESAMDKTIPTVTLTLKEGTKGNNDWYTTDTYIEVKVDDDKSGFGSYKWCNGLDCDPDIVETENNTSKLLTDSSNAQICVIGIDKAGNQSEKICSTEVKVDTTEPEINGIMADSNIPINQEIDLIGGVEATDVTSGIDGTFKILNENNEEITSIDTTKSGTYKVRYVVSDIAGNKNEITVTIEVSGTAPTITYTVEDGIINELGWAKEDFIVTINVVDNSGHGIESFNVCTATTDTCDPSKGSTITGTTGVREIVQEDSNNRICVEVTDKSGKTSTLCSSAYKLDKTAPTTGTIKVNGSSEIKDWYTEDVTIEVVEGSDSLSGHLETTSNITSITENTNGTVVTLTTTDKAGNTSSKDYTIKVDKTIPEVTINKTVSNNKNVLTSSINPTTSTSGYTYEWYKDGSIISEATNSSYETTEAGTYQLKVTTNAGLESTSNEITIESYTVSYNLNGGTGNITNTTKIEDLSTNITLTVPTRDGYEFQGWGTTADDETVDYETNTVYTSNENKTLYAIWKKTVTITFNANGASLSTTSVSCEMYNADENCSITSPVITRSGYTIIGYNTDSSATTSQWNSNTSKSISSNATYNAITSKELTANFSKNTVYSINATSGKCTIYNTETSCNPTLPTITAQTNFTSQNWGTSASQTTTGVTSITLTTSNTGNTWYALNSRSLSWNFDKNAASSISATSASCTIWSTSGSCTITTPTITAATGYTQQGFGTASSSTSKTVAANASMTLNNSTTGGKYYAIQSKTVTVTYAGNGSTSGSTASQTCTMYNAETTCPITLNSNGFTKTNYEFAGWGTGTSEVSHNAGTSYNFSNNSTLNAIWKSAASLTLEEAVEIIITGTCRSVTIESVNAGTLSCDVEGDIYGNPLATCAINGNKLNITANSTGMSGDIIVTVTGSNDNIKATYETFVGPEDAGSDYCNPIATAKCQDYYGTSAASACMSTEISECLNELRFQTCD